MTEATVAPKPKLGYILIRDCRIAFPQLWEPKQVGDNPKLKYSAAFLLHPAHPDLPMIRDAIRDVAREKWSKGWEAYLKAMEATDKTCLHDGNLKANYDGYANNLFINSNSDIAPLLIDNNKRKLALPGDRGRIFAGCYCNARLQLWAQDHQKGGKRINATLAGVQYLREGDSFAAAAAAKDDDFEDVAEGADASDLM